MTRSATPGEPETEAWISPLTSFLRTDVGLQWDDVKSVIVMVDAAIAEARAESSAEMERLAYKAAEIVYTYGALGRDFTYAYKNVTDMLTSQETPDDRG